MPIISGGGSGTGGSSPFLTATATISSAQIKSCFTSPVTVIAAPGANKYINIVSAFTAYVFGTTPYTDTSGNTDAYYTNAAGPTAFIMPAIDGVNASSIHSGIPSQADTAANLVNKAVVVADSVANPTVGDGHFVITVYYTVETLT